MKTRLLVLLLAMAAPANAQEQPMPVLGDHQFVPATRIEDPFINGYVQTSVALGRAANTDTPTYTLPDSTVVTPTGSEQVFIGLSFTYQHQMKNWLAVIAEVEAAGRLGSNTPTLVTEGITGSVAFDLGWKVRAVQTRSFLLSSSFRLSNNAATYVNVLQWAEDLAGGEEAELVISRKSLRGVVGVHAAWGINERFGLVGSAVTSYGESFTGDGDNEWLGDLRMALSYDVRRDLGVPLGLALTVGRSGLTVLEGATVWFWRTRVSVQSREDFSIGIDFGTSYYETLERSTNTQFGELSIDTRYYF